jgi:hypothetical protein
MAVKGTVDARVASKRQKANDNFRKAAIAYSPWTQMGDPGSPDVGNTDPLSGAIGGGIQGAALGSMVGQSGMFKAAGGGMQGAAQAQGATNALGGQDMAKSLGDEFGNSFSGQQMGMASQMPQTAALQAPQVGAASAGALGGQKGVYSNLLGGGDASGQLAQQFGSMDGMMQNQPNSIYKAFMAQNR